VRRRKPGARRRRDESAYTQAKADAEAAKTVADARVAEAQAVAEQRVIRAKLKAHAVKAGIDDLDGLKLLDTSALKIGDAARCRIADRFF
jgi:hypothetical protein